MTVANEIFIIFAVLSAIPYILLSVAAIIIAVILTRNNKNSQRSTRDKRKYKAVARGESNDEETIL